MKRSILFLCLFLFIFFSKTTILYSQVALQDSLALIDIFHSTKGQNWTNHDNWLTNNPVKTWHGVLVENNRVIALQFGTGNNLHDSIPSSIGQLTELKELNLNYNYISYLPVQVGQLTQLQDLYIRSNQLNAIPFSIINSKSLEEIDISANYIPQLPDSIGKLSRLKLLDASYNELDSVPASMSDLPSIFSLNLTGNKFQSIPLVIAKLKGLKELYFGDNPIRTIPAELSYLDSLTILWLDGDLISTVPAEIGKLTKIKDLRLQGNLIRSLPPEIGKIINLNNLDLSYNLLTTLPSELGNLKGLKSLSIVYNGLTELPGTIGNLSSLKELKLQHNFLTSFPMNFGDLKNLSELDLEENSFADTLPSQIGLLQNLTLISFRGNYLKYAKRDDFLNLTKLKWIFLENNRLENLPDFSKDTAITDLTVYSNRLTFEDIEPLMKIPNVRLYYSPQDSIVIKADTNLKSGAFVTLHVEVGGRMNKYKWLKDGVEIPNADSSYFYIKGPDSVYSGKYICRITNPAAPDLILLSREYRLTGTAVTSVAQSSVKIPKEFTLEQNFPNPFNPSTTINYTVPVESKILLKIYSLEGREVRSLVNETQGAGYKSVVWDGRDDLGHNISSGIYLYRLQSGSIFIFRKMLMLK